ncbi:hypothetical protein TNIN_61081 [Trichonephila inaurata madagascariensis]|uniref:Uncharacterized protein n=1 Tax=Trichonephila inaurata madagascariensis TaxID=2747483 RepID=A0A8X6YQL9_9ARAC|nr:hypothetical protein TNIN_61081 [Trichonephila inaurata madagascariensis]
MDMRNDFWYFGDKPSFKVPFSKDVPLPVDDSPVEIYSSSCVPQIRFPVRLSSNRKYDGEKKGNFYHRSNSDTRGRRYGPNSHEKYNNKNQNYQDARRQSYDIEVNNKSDCAQISNESLNEASESISPSDKECFHNNQPECDDKVESKRQDICAGNAYRRGEMHIALILILKWEERLF